jgi:long-chain acyl-CoA synthetase
MGLRDYTIYDFISRNAVLYPERDCIVFNDRRLSFRQFKEKCDRLASGLLQAGIRQGDRLGVVAYNCDEYVILYGAAARIGAVVLPVNWRFQADEMAYVLNDGTPAMIFAGPDFRERMAGIKTALDFEADFYCIGGGEASDGFEPFEALYSDDLADLEVEIDSDTGFVIIHTAAVEGRPRGALLSQQNIFHINLQIMVNDQLDPESCHICILPLFHIAGLAHLMANLHAGGKNVILERFDPKRTLRLIEAEKGTNFFNFAPILKSLIDAYEAGEKVDLSTVKSVGGLDHPENLEQFRRIAPNVEYVAGFGQTEAMAVTWCPLEERPGSAGKPTHIARVAIFDDDDRPVPVGEAGEICVRGPSVFLGYWGLKNDTAYTFRNGWHHTGDIGRFDPDGYLWYVKRKAEKELIKPGGENVYPAEVEKVIRQHPVIAEVSVIGVPDRQWGEAIKAVCVLKPEKELEAQALIDFVADKIARYKKPKFVDFVDSLPKKEDGEIDRERIKKEHGGKF